MNGRSTIERRADRALLLARTLRHVPPSQVAHRIKLRAQRQWYKRRSEPAMRTRWSASTAAASAASPGWPARFEPLDALADHAGIDVVDGGSFSLLGETAWPLRDGWRPRDRSQLFRYHLHYLDWVWPLVAQADHERFAVLWQSWEADTRVGRWDEWSPYVVSLRAWNLCAAYEPLIAGSTVAADVRSNLEVSLGYLRENLERDVGGNHLLKNLKAIFGLAVFFDLPALAGWSLAAVDRQVRAQVLADGGHFELSPGYHTQVLADLVDIDNLAGVAGFASSPTLRDAVRRMALWLHAVSYPDGTVPLIGDTTPPDATVLQRLRSLVDPPVPEPVIVLPDTGLVVSRPRPGAVAVFDFGRPCPAELPAHAQADWGTFELWLDGDRVVLDPGVSAYVGERRAWERSTQAHNTLLVDDLDQTEVWGSFRAGRRAVPSPITVNARAGRTSISAELTSFGGRRQRREVTVTADRLTIVDAVTSGARASSAVTVDPHHVGRVTAESGVTLARSEVLVGEGFGRLRPAIRVEQPLQPCIGSAAVPKTAPGHSRSGVPLRGGWQIDLRAVVADG